MLNDISLYVMKSRLSNVLIVAIEDNLNTVLSDTWMEIESIMWRSRNPSSYLLVVCDASWKSNHFKN